MQLLDFLIMILLIVGSFIAGLRLDNYYHNKASRDQKEALEKQFLRLRARMDADDPCKPYGTPQLYRQIPVTYNTGDTDGDSPLNEAFMNELHSKGRAKTTFRKSDLAK